MGQRFFHLVHQHQAQVAGLQALQGGVDGDELAPDLLDVLRARRAGQAFAQQGHHLAVATAALLAWGMYIGSRRELLWTLQRRAEDAEHQSVLREEGARVAERARIAREMHDVLAHRISQVSMRAGALAFRTDLPPERLREGIGEVQDQANAALSDLRSVLGVLRDDRGEIADAPQPDFTDLPSMVAEARSHGMQVEYVEDVPAAAEMPVALGRTVYRIVQEGLTNAGKHAPGAVVRVNVSGAPEQGIDVRVVNPLGFGADRSAVPFSGLGLVGLAERATLRGGRLEHSRVDRQWVLHGWLPWPA